MQLQTEILPWNQNCARSCLKIPILRAVKLLIQMINRSVNIVLGNKSYSPGNTNFVTLTTNKSTHVIAYRNSYRKHVQIAPLIMNSIHMHSTPLPLRMLLCGESLLDFLFSVLGQWNTPQSRSQMTA